MSYTVEPTARFKRSLKRLSKRHRSITDDVVKLRAILEEDPTYGTHVGGRHYKIRLAIKSKGRGKSGGARVITTVLVTDKKVLLLDIYDKADRATMSAAEIAAAQSEHEASAADGEREGAAE